MLDSYDMPMLDYPSDLDIQMHPSAADQWIQDEARMEEDGSYLPFKADFEVDMEPSTNHENVEYDMLDDQEIHSSRAELLDVEVYDVSLAQSPAMPNFDLPHEQSQSDLTSFRRAHSSIGPHEESLPISSNFLLGQSGLHVLEPSLEEASFQEDSETPIQENPIKFTDEPHQPPAEPLVFHQGQNDFHDSRDGSEISSLADGHGHNQTPAKNDPTNAEVMSSTDGPGSQSESHASIDDAVSHTENQAADQSQDGPHDGGAFTLSNVQITEVVQEIPVVEVEAARQTSDSGYNKFPDQELEQHIEEQEPPEQSLEEQDHDPEVRIEAKLVDPHEISEGVYIDPPPPVLLSFASEDEISFYLFNQIRDLDVNSKDPPTHQVLLHQQPTLYYEPLSTVFDALRQEEAVQSSFPLADGELVLEATDLHLIIGEDNVYAVDVSLHDLNVLHDGSGIGGLLRTRLSTVSPRFITRYQYLQGQVNRLHLEQPSIETRTHPITEPEVSQSVHQGVAVLSEQEEGDLAQPVEAAESNIPDADTDNEVDLDQSFSQVPVRQFLEGSLSTSASVELQGGNQDDDLREGVGSISPTETEDQDDQFSSDYASVADHSSTAEGLQTVDHSEHHINDDAISHETLEASDRGDDTYDQKGPTCLTQKIPSADLAGQGELEAEQGVDEFSYNTALGAQDLLDKVNVAISSASSCSSTTEDGTIGEIENVSHAYDFEEQAELEEKEEEEEASKDLQRDREETSAHDHIDNKEQENQSEGDKDTEGDLATAAEAARDLVEEEYWEDDLDGEGDFDSTWEEGHGNSLSQSNHSSVTLSSTASKRSFDEFEFAGDLYEEETRSRSPVSSPESKRSRIQ